MIVKYVTQPRVGAKYTELFGLAFSYATFQKIDVAVAYATLKGILSLRDAISVSNESVWRKLSKRWVVGIDWCRTEPLALEYLAGLTHSESRIFDGLSVVNRKGCAPSIPFHPKVFILQSDTTTAVISGSANLSVNGQTRGHEVGSLVLYEKSENEQGGDLESSLSDVTSWFEDIWIPSSPLVDILPPYTDRYEAHEHLQSPVPTEDDATQLPGSRRRALSEKQLRQLRACRHLWVQAGKLHANRGPGRPGNQLMLSPLTRVFFGLDATDVPTDTRVGYVKIEFEGKVRDDCALRYSNNAMDVLGLPIPDIEGPPHYDDETLLFEQVVDPSGVKYILRVGSASDRRSWRQRSNQVSGSFKMTSGRQWGVF